MQWWSPMALRAKGVVKMMATRNPPTMSATWCACARVRVRARVGVRAWTQRGRRTHSSRRGRARHASRVRLPAALQPAGRMPMLAWQPTHSTRRTHVVPEPGAAYEPGQAQDQQDKRVDERVPQLLQQARPHPLPAVQLDRRVHAACMQRGHGWHVLLGACVFLTQARGLNSTTRSAGLLGGGCCHMARALALLVRHMRPGGNTRARAAHSLG
jgi:hypothetical protein